MKKRFMLLALILLLAITLTGCMASRVDDGDDPAGFFTGIWHGWIAPIGLIGGLFNSNITIYEVNNSGWWYDFGFYMAVISGFGGLTITRGKKKKD